MKQMEQADKDALRMRQYSGLVLFVDDEEVIRTVGSTILKHMGFDVILAEGGQSGIDKYSKYSDELVLVILDLTMPDLDGDIVFSKMMEIRNDIPVIMSTGYNEGEIAERFKGKTLAGYICKPYRSKNLRDKITQVLGKTEQ